METGSELCLDVGPDAVPIRYGWKAAPDEEDKLLIEEGLADKKKPCDFAIEPGRWHFEQLEYLPDAHELERELSPSIAEGCSSPVHIRLLKENALELVVQLLWLPRE